MKWSFVLNYTGQTALKEIPKEAKILGIRTTKGILLLDVERPDSDDMECPTRFFVVTGDPDQQKAYDDTPGYTRIGQADTQTGFCFVAYERLDPPSSTSISQGQSG